jgi:hypothetical protein
MSFILEEDMINSRGKGKKGEREWVRLYREEEFIDVRRGQECSGIEGETRTYIRWRREIVGMVAKRWGL